MMSDVEYQKLDSDGDQKNDEETYGDAGNRENDDDETKRLVDAEENASNSVDKQLNVSTRSDTSRHNLQIGKDNDQSGHQKDL